MKPNFLLTITILSLVMLSCGGKKVKVSQEADIAPTVVETPKDEFTDTRNNQVYRFVNIGGKTWMAQNLNYQTTDSYCYENNNANCDRYGRLYTWNAATQACPQNWRLPTSADWNALTNAAGGDEVAGTALKSRSDWAASEGETVIPATDEFNFGALPGGVHDADGFYNLGIFGYFWSATTRDDEHAWFRSMTGVLSSVYSNTHDKTNAFSVRCVRD